MITQTTSKLPYGERARGNKKHVCGKAAPSGGMQEGHAPPKTQKNISRSQARVENTEPGDVRGEIGVEMVDELGEPEARPESGTGTTFGSQAAIGTRISAPEKGATEQACGEQRLEDVHAC